MSVEQWACVRETSPGVYETIDGPRAAWRNWTVPDRPDHPSDALRAPGDVVGWADDVDGAIRASLGWRVVTVVNAPIADDRDIKDHSVSYDDSTGAPRQIHTWTAKTTAELAADRQFTSGLFWGEMVVLSRTLLSPENVPSADIDDYAQSIIAAAPDTVLTDLEREKYGVKLKRASIFPRLEGGVDELAPLISMVLSTAEGSPITVTTVAAELDTIFAARGQRIPAS